MFFYFLEDNVVYQTAINFIVKYTIKLNNFFNNASWKFLIISTLVYYLTNIDSNFTTNNLIDMKLINELYYDYCSNINKNYY